MTRPLSVDILADFLVNLVWLSHCWCKIFNPTVSWLYSRILRPTWQV